MLIHEFKRILFKRNGLIIILISMILIALLYFVTESNDYININIEANKVKFLEYESKYSGLCDDDKLIEINEMYLYVNNELIPKMSSNMADYKNGLITSI